MPAVFIFPVNAVGCNLKTVLIQKYGDRSMFNPRVKRLFKQRLRLLRRVRGRDILVLRFPPQNRIPYASAYRISLVPMLHKGSDNCIYFFR